MVNGNGGLTFAQWRNQQFVPAKLPTTSLESGGARNYVSRAIEEDPIRGVSALMYNLEDTECLALAQEMLTDTWATKLLQQLTLNDDVLSMLLLVADMGYCHDALLKHLASLVPNGRLSQAFARALKRSTPRDLVELTAEALASLDHAEILEKSELLCEWSVANGYLQLLSEDQYKTLCAFIGINPTRELLARWLSKDAPIEFAPLPDVPPGFDLPENFWQWYREHLASTEPKLGSAWNHLYGRRADLLGWWTAIERSKTHRTRLEASASMRRLDLTVGEHPFFQVLYKQELRGPEELLAQLKEEAGIRGVVYTQSARAAAVSLRSEPGKVSALRRLEPLEVLTSSESTRYLFIYGAHRSRLDFETVKRLAPQSGTTSALYDVVTFRSDTSFAEIALVLAHVFPETCALISAWLDESTLGLRPAKCGEI